MTNEDIKKLSNKTLKTKASNIKTLIIILTLAFIGLLYFGIQDYLNGETKTPITIITICTLGGLISLLPALKQLRKELRERN